MLVTHATPLAGAPVAALLFSPLGIPFFGIVGLFGIFGALILILFVASLFGDRSRSHGDPSGLGIAVGFGVFIVLAVAIDAAMG